MKEIKHWTHTEDKVSYHGEFRSIEATLVAAADYYNEGDVFFLCSVHSYEISDFFNADNLVEDLKCQAQEEVGSLDFWLHDLRKAEEFDLNSMISKTLKVWAKQYNREPHFSGVRESGKYTIKNGSSIEIQSFEEEQVLGSGPNVG